MSGTLYVVATPIGNLQDLSDRARQTLSEVDLIAAEDTRHTGRLLSHFGLKTPQLALHDHNEEQQVATLIERLLNGADVAIVSDAGTPLLSDPGFRLVRAALTAGVPVSPVPGASAISAALSVSGLPTDRFCFEGFLPAKQKSREDMLRRLQSEPRTMVFFESVHRMKPTLQAMVQIFGANREAFIGRELTKLHEQCEKATLATLLDRLAGGAITHKGEFVIVVAGASDTEVLASAVVERLLQEFAGLLPGKTVAKAIAAATGEKRNQLYARLLEIQSTR